MNKNRLPKKKTTVYTISAAFYKCSFALLITQWDKSYGSVEKTLWQRQEFLMDAHLQIWRSWSLMVL